MSITARWAPGFPLRCQVKHGPVTLLSVIEDKDNGFALLVAEGESVPGAILEIGNTNSRYRFPLGARKFVESLELTRSRTSLRHRRWARVLPDREG